MEDTTKVSPNNQETDTVKDVNSDIIETMTERMNEKMAAFEKMLKDITDKFSESQTNMSSNPEPSKSHIVSYPKKPEPTTFTDDQWVKFIEDTYRKVENQHLTMREETQIPTNG